jgi:hypothetical protein
VKWLLTLQREKSKPVVFLASMVALGVAACSQAPTATPAVTDLISPSIAHAQLSGTSSGSGDALGGYTKQVAAALTKSISEPASGRVLRSAADEAVAQRSGNADTPFDASVICPIAQVPYSTPEVESEQPSPGRTDCFFGSADGGLKVALIGDTGAAMFKPTLAHIADANARLSIRYMIDPVCFNTRDEELVFGQSSTFQGADSRTVIARCTDFHTRVTTALRSYKPRLVLLSSLYRGLQNDAFNNLKVGSRDFLKELQEASPTSTFVVILPTPQVPDSGSCLNADLSNPNDCSAPINRALSVANKIVQIGVPKGMHMLNLTPLFCADAVCPGVVGEDLTTIDGFVLKASYARTIAAAFAEIVRARTGIRLDR